MTTAQVIYALLKFYPSAYDVKEAVSSHRTKNANWNWSDAAHDLLNTLQEAA